MKKERYLESFGFTCFLEGNKLLFVEADVIRPVFCTNKIEAYLDVSWSPSTQSFVSLTAYQVRKLFLQLNALLHFLLHHLLWDGTRRAVYDPETKRKLVQPVFFAQFLLFLHHTINDQLHLSSVTDLSCTVIRGYRLVQQHGSELGIHDLLVNHLVDSLSNVPFVDTLVV